MSSLLEKLMLLESTVGEEYYILVQLKTLQYMTREIREIYNVDLEDLKDILETIIRDEETHRELLSKMKKSLSEKKSRQKIWRQQSSTKIRAHGQGKCLIHSAKTLASLKRVLNFRHVSGKKYA